MGTPVKKLRKDGTEKRKTGPKPGPKKALAVLPSKGTGKRVSLSVGTKLSILDEMEAKGWSQGVTAQKYSTKLGVNISQANISRWLKERSGWLTKIAENPNAANSRRIKEVDFPGMELTLAEWITRREAAGESVTGPLIIEKARRICNALGITEDQISLSNGWLELFKKRHNLQKQKLNGEAASVNPQTAEEERLRLRPILAKYAPEDRFNADESGFFYRQLLSYALGTTAMSGKKLDKTRLTILVGSNQTGTEKLPLLFIGKAKKPRCFRGSTARQLGFIYHNNQKAWMTGVIFGQWLEGFNEDMKREGRKVLLLLDNFSGHQWDRSKITNVEVEFLRPNLTAYVQPMDAGIIRTLKAIYKKGLLSRSIIREDAGEEDIFKIDMLEAIRALQDAWNSVSATTIANCWRHTGIVPNSTPPDNNRPVEDPSTTSAVSEAEQAIEELNNKIENRTGARVAAPRPGLLPGIEELLKDPPPPEFPLLDDESELIKEVLEVDEEEEDEDITALESSTDYLKMLQSLSYLAIFRQNDPTFAKLGESVREVQRRLCLERSEAMKETTIDSFFLPVTSQKTKSVDFIDIDAMETDSTT